MRVQARHIVNDQVPFVLDVRTNPFSMFHIGKAIKVKGYTFVDGELNELPGTVSYDTIAMFLTEWIVITSDKLRIKLPIIKKEHGLGDVVGAVLAKVGIHPRGDCGCPSRKEWFNWLLSFVPLDGASDATQPTE